MTGANGLNDKDAEKLAIAIAKALQQSRSVSDSEHYDHHRWISAKIARENAMRDFYDEMKKHVIKWGAISMITGIGYAAWLGFKAVIKVS